MMSSKEHINWITVGEVINVIKKPVALYTTHMVERWHITLCKDCLSFGRCRSPGTCEKKMKPGDLCSSCNGWYNKLAKSHQNKDRRKIEWRKNCDTSKFPIDAWEVAKFFMPVLGDNKSSVTDAASTDLSYLLNVLTWMKDVAFVPDRRVDLDLVKELRSVRNLWAHAPNQELTDDDFNNAFDIANKFVADIDNVFSCDEVKDCIENIKFTQINKLTNVGEAELRALNSQRDVLDADVWQLKEEMKQVKEDKSVDSQVIKEQETMLKKLVNAQQECSTRMNSLCREIGEIRADIKSLQGTNNRFQRKSCLPDKPSKIFGRDAEVKKIVNTLVHDGCGIVSIVGGPGFGKSTVAIEVSHRLSDSHSIEVIFSFLSNVSTVPEVIQCLCNDVGENPGDDPKSSLIFWLKNIDKRVVLVMDNIEQLLESNVISQFTELAVMLRKNSRRQLQILTTTRTEFSIPDGTTENVHVRELDKNDCVELLRNFCGNKDVKEEHLSELAKLCGFVPLALCIIGSRIPRNDPTELIKWLKDKPIKALQSKTKCVQKAIEISFQMLSDEDKKAFARLSVFSGNFQRKSAEEVIEKDDFETQDLLDELVARSLMQSYSDNRFLIHSLIRRFLADDDQLQGEKTIAQGLMVKHVLKMCHLWTKDSYTKDGFADAREKLKKDSHNIEEAFKIGSQDQTKDLNPKVIEYLESSDIYKSSSRFFYNFAWDIFQPAVLISFFKSCMKIAETREQAAIQITFQCLVADQEGRGVSWNSNEYMESMEAVRVAFEKNEAVLKEDGSLYRYCYYSLSRYYSNIATNARYVDPLDDHLVPLSDKEYQTPMENAEQAFILIERARLSKKRATKVFKSNKKKYKDYMNRAELHYGQALSTAKELLGDHELTCRCRKVLGDLYLLWKKYEDAVSYYSDAIKLSEKLQLDSNEAFANLLKNYGLCLRYLGRFEKSVENLNKARDIVDKLGENRTPCRASVYYLLAETYRAWKPDCQEAAKCATVAKEMDVLLDQRNVKSLEDIIKTAKEYTDDKNRIAILHSIVNVAKTDRQLQRKGDLPEKPQAFIERSAEVNKIINCLVEEGCGIVSIVGGPGFGKSTVAVDVSHHISNKYDIVVIFSLLSNVSTVPEVVLRLCHNVGVNPGEDPESALMFWLKNIEKKVVLVMDNIEQMLEVEKVRSEFTELVLTLRKNSQQQLQILTTTRTEFFICGETTENILLRELDEESSVELLKKFCLNTQVKDSYLCHLANLCGFIPLALCVAGPRISGLLDTSELIHSLEKKPAKTLLISDESQCAQKAIEFSFQKLNDDERKSLARLSLFNGDFQRKSAEEVIKRNYVKNQDLLERFVALSLIQRSSDKRFVIHSLIRCFLADHHQLQHERVIAQGLMVKHFLKMCHSLTMDSLSKNGFRSARELLKTDSHNVEETLKVCSQDRRNLNPNILQLLVNSDIYKSSSRFFYRFCRDLLSQVILRNFQEYCINVAKNQKQLTVEITFRCLVADQVGRKSAWKSEEYIDMMKAIKAALDKSKAVLKEDMYLYRYCYYFYARFRSNQTKNRLYPDLKEDDLVSLPENDDRSPMKNAEDTLTLIERAQLSKKRAMKERYSSKKKYEEYMNYAESFARQALSKSQELLGDHELTWISHKVLGDLYSFWRKNSEAWPFYFDAIDLSRKLELDSNEAFVSLLKNCGKCLHFLCHFDESAEILNEARNMADKLTQKHSFCRVSVYCALAEMYCAWRPDCREAAKYANAAIEMGELLESSSVKTMEDIIKRSEQHME